jgi:hypothetical protein
MATSNRSKYSTYAGLDTEAPVNWGSVANTISKQVNLFNEKRKADQQAVEDATQSAIEKLNELPDVNNQSLDKALLDSAKSQQEQLMMNMKLVRKGVFKMHDYKMRMNEMKNGYTNFKNITKVYDGWWTAAQERVKNNTATEADKAFMKRIESFGNLNNKKFMTNPANGQLQVVTMGFNDKTKQYDIMPDPKANPDAFQNPGVILDMMKYDGGVKVDLDEATNNIVDNLGEMMTAYVTPDGKTYTLTDFRQMFNDETRLKKLGLPEGITTFDQWLDSQAEAFVGNDADMAQILATQAGYQFDDPSKANYIELKGTGNTVKFGKDGKGLSEDERKKAKDIVKRMIANKMDSKQTAQRGFDDRDNVKEKEDRGISFDIAYDVTSGGKPSNAAIEKIKANNDTISNIYKDPTTNEFVIQYSDGSSPKRIKPATKMVNGDEVYDAKESAVSLMAAVTPGGDVVTAEKARDEYKGGDKTYVNEFNTDKIKVSASNSSTGFMNATKTVDGKIVPVSISESFEEIATSDTGIDEDSAPLYNKLFKGLALEEGTENLISNISVVPSPRSTQSDDVIRVTGLPPEVMALIDTSDIVFSGDTEHGDDYIEVSVEELDSSGNDAGLRYIVDKILQASADQYNGVTGTSESNSSDDINTGTYNTSN